MTAVSSQDCAGDESGVLYRKVSIMRYRMRASYRTVNGRNVLSGYVVEDSYGMPGNTLVMQSYDAKLGKGLMENITDYLNAGTLSVEKRITR